MAPALVLGVVVAACTRPADHATPTEVTWRVSKEVATVIEVSWTTEVPTTGHVEFGDSEEYGRVTPETDVGTEHKVLLLGLPSDTDVSFGVVSSDLQGTTRLDGFVAATEPLPSGLVDLKVKGATIDGYTCLPITGTRVDELIVDANGEIVWYRVLDPGAAHANTRCVFGADGRSVIHTDSRVLDVDVESFVATGTLWSAPIDGGQATEIAGIDSMSHDFTQLPDGTLAVIVQRRYTLDGAVVYADSLVEVDPELGLVDVWSVLDTFTPGVDLPVLTGGWWLHANAVDYSPKEDAYYVGIRENGSIVKVDRATGRAEWIMGGTRSDFTFVGGTVPWGTVHQFDFSDDDVLVFRNNVNAIDDTAAVVRYAIDWSNRTLTQTWQHDIGSVIPALGDVTRVGEGVIGVSWSTTGIYTHIQGGDETYVLGAPIGQAFGYATSFPSLYVE